MLLGQIVAQTGVQHLLVRSSQCHLLGSLTTGPELTGRGTSLVARGPWCSLVLAVLRWQQAYRKPPQEPWISPEVIQHDRKNSQLPERHVPALPCDSSTGAGAGAGHGSAKITQSHHTD